MAQTTKNGVVLIADDDPEILTMLGIAAPSQLPAACIALKGFR